MQNFEPHPIEGPILVNHVAITKDTIDQWYPQK